MQLLDMPWEKSRKMERREESGPGSEVRIFKRLFTADLKSDGRESDSPGKGVEWEKLNR